MARDERGWGGRHPALLALSPLIALVAAITVVTYLHSGWRGLESLALHGGAGLVVAALAFAQPHLRGRRRSRRDPGDA